MKWKLIIGFILICNSSFSQKYTLSGFVKDASSGEDIYGVVIKVKELSNTGTLTNPYGFYSLTLDSGQYTIIYHQIGFEQQEQKINLTQNIERNIELKVPEGLLELKEVKVSAVKENDNITSSEMNVTRFDPKSVETIPVFFGEKDILRVVQLMPGVNGAGEGNVGFNVRGGGTDQNLLLLDEASVYNAAHLLGFFSVFNSDAIKDVSLYKSGIPAQYGGRVSSVMDVKMKEGNNKKYSVSGGLGVISSRLTVEGPIKKNKGSFIISGRRTYVDYLVSLYNKIKKQEADGSLFFYDANLKANYRLSDKDRVFLSGYFGRDKFSADDFRFGWGNATGTLRWNHLFSTKLFSNTTLVYSNYKYEFGIGDEQNGFGIHSSINDWNLKQDFSYYLNGNNLFKFGLNGTHHTYLPGSVSGSSESAEESTLDSRYAIEVGAYVQHEIKFGSRFNIMYGLRYSGFNLIGEGKAFEFDEEGNKTSEKSYDSGESIAYHHGLEPRFSAGYIISEKSSIKLGYNRIYQYVHQLSNSTSGDPTDSWIPSSNNVKPQIADQIALGYYQNLKGNMYQISGEAYYKILGNQIDYRDWANLTLNNEIEGELVYGTGEAYGFECQIKKSKGKFTGWVSYTISRSLRTFDEINDGKQFSARADRIHDFSIVTMYKVNKAISLSANWIYYTGDVVTFPSGKYEVDGVQVPYYTERNGHRMPNYHRLDLGFTWYMKERKHFERNLSISIYNAYARRNAYAITFEEVDHDKNPDTPTETRAMQTTLFRMLPSMTFNFKIK